MSAKAIDSILSRALSDSAFADLLFSDLDQAPSGYDLTPAEASGFKELTRAEFDSLAVDARKSFSMDAMRKAGCSGED